MKNNVMRLGALGSGLVAGGAHAAVDVTGVVTEIGDALVPIGLIGSAVLLVFLAVKTFRWIRAAMA